MEEKRKHKRVEIHKPIQSEEHPISQGVNVSMGGIQVMMKDKLKNGDNINMDFFIPGVPHKFRVEATVIWQTPKGKEFLTGFEFQKIRVDK